MNVTSFRWIDKNLGSVICFFLTLHRKIFYFFEKKTFTRPLSIVFIKFIEQGAIVLAYPALKKAVDMAGRDNVYFILSKQNRPVFDVFDILPAENIIEVDLDNFWAAISSSIKALFIVRGKKIDAVIDLELFLRASAILAYLCNCRCRVGVHIFTSEGPYRGDLFTHKLICNTYLHMKLFFAGMVEALRYPPSSFPLMFEVPEVSDLPSFFADTKERRLLIEKIEKIKGAPLSKPFIVLNPNSSELLPIRRWPENNFIALGNKILTEFADATILITGSVEEKNGSQRISEQIKGSVSIAGKTSIRELLILYLLADILVTNDSGPAHFAALAPVKAIVLFGPETRLLYGPEGLQNKVISKNFICSPCINAYNHKNSPCRQGMCLKNIKVDEVFEEIKVFLKSVPPNSQKIKNEICVSF